MPNKRPANRPSWERTHTFIKRLADLITFGMIAKLGGKSMQTAEAWGRPVESNDEPTGTGKHNPLDTVIRLIGRAYKEDAALAREMAETFTEYVDYLDGRERTRGIHADLRELVLDSVREHMDVVDTALRSDHPDFEAVHKELAEAKIAIANIERFVEEELRPKRSAAARN